MTWHGHPAHEEYHFTGWKPVPPLMNARERFLAVMEFQPCDRSLLWELGYWGGTLHKWYREGLTKRCGVRDDIIHGTSLAGEAMPAADAFDPDLKKLFPTKDTRDRDVHDCLGLDHGFVMLPINTSLSPAFVPSVIEDRGDTQLETDGFGVVREGRKTGDSVPRYARWPVESAQDFDRLKERLQPGLASRVPENWKDLVSEYRTREFPLVLGFCGEGFFGNLRRLMGDVKLCTTYYDDPALVRHMNSHFTDLWINLWDEAFRVVKPDCAWFFEDMCYKNGPLISPSLFREFMMPYYQKITRFLDDHRVSIRLADTDGDCWQLIPLFLEAGVTGLTPFEVAAGMDVVKVREAFPKLQMLGGLDKQALAKGREAIDAELDYKLPPMLDRGGYIPHADHLVPPDVSWEHFRYYRNKVRDYVCLRTR